MLLESTVLTGEQENTRQRMYNNEATSLKRPPQHIFWRLSFARPNKILHPLSQCVKYDRLNVVIRRRLGPVVSCGCYLLSKQEWQSTLSLKVLLLPCNRSYHRVVYFDLELMKDCVLWKIHHVLYRYASGCGFWIHYESWPTRQQLFWGDCLTQSKAGFSRIGLIDLCSEICDLLFSAIPVITKYFDFLLNILNSWYLGAVLEKAEQLITGRIRKFGFLKWLCYHDAAVVCILQSLITFENRISKF